MVIVRAHFNVTTATATMPTTNNSATMSSRGSSNVRGGTRKIMAPTANAKEHTQRKVCVPSSFWAALLFAAGVLVQGGESATIVETKEWKACVAKKGGCTQIDVQRRGLTGTIPANICEVNPNLQRLYVLLMTDALLCYCSVQFVQWVTYIKQLLTMVHIFKQLFPSLAGSVQDAILIDMHNNMIILLLRPVCFLFVGWYNAGYSP